MTVLEKNTSSKVKQIGTNALLEQFRLRFLTKRFFLVLCLPFLNFFSTNGSVLIAKSVPIQVGEWYLEPRVDVKYGSTEIDYENLQQRNEDSFTSIEPQISLYNNNRNRQIELKYHGKKTDFSENTGSDYFSDLISGEYKQFVSDSSQLSLRAEYERGDQAQGVRGDIESISLNDERKPVDYSIKSKVLKYDFYGSKKAGHSFSVSVGDSELRFTQDQDQSLADRQRDEFSIDMKWRYAWSGNKAIFTKAEFTEFDYFANNNLINAELDNRELRFLFGSEWRIKRNLYVELGAGFIKKQFDNSDVDVQLPAFYGQVEMLQSERDTIKLNVQHKPIEQAGAGIFQDFREIELGWIRRLTPRLSMEAYIGKGDVEYELSSRQDDFTRYGLLFEYRLSRTTDIIFGYQYYNDDSNIDFFDYEGSNVFINFSIGL